MRLSVFHPVLDKENTFELFNREVSCRLTFNQNHEKYNIRIRAVFKYLIICRVTRKDSYLTEFSYMSNFCDGMTNLFMLEGWK
jgi:hypothetical protein